MNFIIKDIPIEERPRERLLKYGVNNLSDIEIIAIILKSGTKGESALNVATKIVKEIGGIKNLKDINREMLIKIKGIGDAKATEFLATIEFGKRMFIVEDTKKKEKMNNASIIYDKNKYLFLNQNQEYFYCLYLNNKKELIERKLLFIGTINKSIVHPREIFKEAYLLSASSIVCMHNHPSGDITPSDDDINLTKALMEIGKLQQIPLLDHIIFGNENYYSFYENNTYIR